MPSQQAEGHLVDKISGILLVHLVLIVIVMNEDESGLRRIFSSALGSGSLSDNRGDFYG